ncbi:MAG: hypothetical protein KAJ19_12395, partial [Gammaproteobacteria bacterium]|nr:hypothetical protein [Gammaproteobacteria bacterium]
NSSPRKYLYLSPIIAGVQLGYKDAVKIAAGGGFKGLMFKHALKKYTPNGRSAFVKYSFAL